MRYTYLITLLILASATLGSAQFEDSDLSKSCTDTLQKMVGDKEINACLPLLSLASLAGSGSKDSKPDLNAFKTAADKVCGLPKCSEDLVSKTQQDFQTACQSDLNSKKDVAIYLDLAFEFYPPTRDSVCFKNSTGDYCFIESALAAYQVAESAPKDQPPLLTFFSAPKEVVCTPCNKAISNTYFNYQKTNPEAFTKLKQVTSQDPDDLKSTLTSKCGDKFLDGDTSGSEESPKSFQEKNENDKSDASTLIVNGLSFIALAGSALALL